MKKTKIAFPTDEHFPFQDDRARSIALQIVRDFDPHIRVAGSDGMDFYSISKFDKNPARAITIQTEINDWKRGQREWIDAAPNAKGFYIIGNHEDRMMRWLWTHPEVADLEVLQLHSLLSLEMLGIYWEHNKGFDANRELVAHNKIVIKHGSFVRKYSAYSARAELEKELYQLSVVTGHTHRGGTHMVTTRNGVVVAQEAFCLCSLNPEYVRKPDWQQGIVLVTVSPEDLNIEAIPFFIKNGRTKAIWREKEYIDE